MEIFDYSDFGHKQVEIFQIASNYINVNHASYGYFPKEIQELKLNYIKEMNSNTEKWFRVNLYKRIKDAIVKAAEFIGADPKNVVFTLNSSDSFNAIIKSLNLKKGDKVLISNIQYIMVVKTLQFLKDQAGIEIVEVKLTQQDIQTKEGILKKYEETIKSNQGINVAVLEHISSFPSLLFPIKELIELVRKNQIISIVDGAHGVGLVDLQLDDLRPDFYFSNFHKWGFCPRSVAVMYVSPQFHAIIHPNIISYLYGSGFQSEFSYIGTFDQSNIMVVPDAINYMKQLGIPRVRAYVQKMAWEGSGLIASIWKTERMIVDEQMQVGQIMIRSPINNGPLLKKVSNYMLQNEDETGICSFINFEEFDGQCWGRISGHIYNELSDYEKVGNLFLETLRKVEKQLN